MITIFARTNPSLVAYFDQEFGLEGPDPEMFLGIDGTLDPMYYGAGNPLSFAREYANGLELAEMQTLLDTSHGDVLAFRYFGTLPKPAHQCLFTDEWLKALYWTTVSITLAGLYRYVEAKQRSLSS